MGVLVAIAIPIFTAQLEKAREATDEANIRSLYAECASEALTATAAGTSADGKVTITQDSSTKVFTCTATYTLRQQKDGLEGGVSSINIGGVDVTGWGPGKTATITVKSDGSPATIVIS